MNIKIRNLDSCKYSSRNGSYGGVAGDKDGIILDGENWIVKYPKPNVGMSKISKLAKFSYGPLSEFLGSKIYEMLGYDVHKTILGVRKGFLVVACKDFCDGKTRLHEIRTVKNVHISELEKQFNVELHETGDDYLISLKELFLHFNFNPELKNIDGLEKRFWDQVIIDGLIGNNDRNSGNWGILISESKKRLAPIFDNGASFYPKKSEEAIKEFLLKSKDERKKDESNVVMPYTIGGSHHLNYRNMLNLTSQEIGEQNFSCLKASILDNFNRVKTNIEKIECLFTSIPEKYDNLEILTRARSQYYFESFQNRFEDILTPIAERIRKI